jgi:hypothetical protein
VATNVSLLNATVKEDGFVTKASSAKVGLSPAPTLSLSTSAIASVVASSLAIEQALIQFLLLVKHNIPNLGSAQRFVWQQVVYATPHSAMHSAYSPRAGRFKKKKTRSVGC